MLTLAQDLSGDTPHSINDLVQMIWDLRDTQGLGCDINETLTLLHPDYPLLPQALISAALTLTSRFEESGNIADIDDSITYLERSLSLQVGCAQEEQDTIGIAVETLSLLGHALFQRFMHSKNFEDIDAATEHHRMALTLSSPEDPMYLQNLSRLVGVLRLRIFKHRRKEDSDEAIRWQREAVSLSQTQSEEDEGDLAESLTALGNLLMLRYQTFSLGVDLEEATESYENALAVLPDNSEMRPQYLKHLVVSLQETFAAKGQVEALNGATDRLREAITCLSSGTVPLDEDETQGYMAEFLNGLGYLLMLRYQTFSLVVDLEEATESYGKALALSPDNSEIRPQYLRHLVMSLQVTLAEKDQAKDLNGVINHLREAIGYLSDGTVPFDEDETQGYLAEFLNGLGDLLILRYRKVRQAVDLEEATESYGKALVFLSDDSKMRPQYLRNLAVSLQETFEAESQIEDLNAAIDRVREALACLSGRNVPPAECEALVHLGMLLNVRFRWTGGKSDLDEAIQSQHQVMKLDPTERHSALYNLSLHLFALYTTTGDHSDLERALDFSRDAFELCPIDDNFYRLRIKRQMASCLDAQLQWSDRREDLEEALKIRRELVALTEGMAEHRTDLRYLVHSLHSQWRRDPGQLSALDEGMKELRDVLPAIGHSPDRTEVLYELGVSSYNRYQRHSAPEDLEESIKYFRELAALIPPSRGHFQHANETLAGALLSRFLLFRRIEDIDDAVGYAREAVAFARSCYSRDHLVTCLSVLGTCLELRSDRILCKLDGIEEAITVRREVVSLSPPASDIWIALRQLAVSILKRHVELKQPEGIEEAIVLLRKSLALIPAGHPDKLMSLSALATVAVTRCQLGGGIEYRKEALEICRESVAAYDRFPSDKDYCLAVSNLAEACWINGDEKEAVTLYEQAVNLHYATPHYRFITATRWADLTRQAGHSSSLRAHMKALELLDWCLTSTPTIDLQHQFLTQNTSTLATNAASCAIEKGELGIAVQALEQGRALLWSRMRGYRHPIEKLQELDAGLAEQFKGVCQQLERLNVSSEYKVLGVPPIPISITPQAAHELEFDAKVTNNRELLDDYERIVSEIRQLDGFTSFLQATPFPSLQEAASGGPIILVNVNGHRSDAMILRATKTPFLVPLPKSLSATVDKLSSRLLVVDRVNRNEDRKGISRQPKQFDMSNILQILWKEVCQPIALALQGMGHPEGSRVWWCPVGRLGALPLHAAGIYNDKGILTEGFPDLYVSSYTPTLSSLIASRETAVSAGSETRLLAVGQSNSLPKVKDEFSKLEILFPSKSLKIRDGEKAEIDTVLCHLQDHPWVHFACHGSLDASSPFKSGFVLHNNKKLTLRDIMQARLPNAELAFLAACHSAAMESESETPDEVLTLAAAMQFCGFRSIVGTLWTMSDNDGPVLAEKFYTHMLRNGFDKMDVCDSAEAVHLATKSMREAGVPPHRWTTFVHVGI